MLLECGKPGIDVAASMRMSALRVWAARSRVMLPLLVLKRPRWVEKPKWPISKLGNVCFGSTV